MLNLLSFLSSSSETSGRRFILPFFHSCLPAVSVRGRREEGLHIPFLFLEEGDSSCFSLSSASATGDFLVLGGAGERWKGGDRPRSPGKNGGRSVSHLFSLISKNRNFFPCRELLPGGKKNVMVALSPLKRGGLLTAILGLHSCEEREEEKNDSFMRFAGKKGVIRSHCIREATRGGRVKEKSPDVRKKRGEKKGRERSCWRKRKKMSVARVSYSLDVKATVRRGGGGRTTKGRKGKGSPPPEKGGRASVPKKAHIGKGKKGRRYGQGAFERESFSSKKSGGPLEEKDIKEEKNNSGEERDPQPEGQKERREREREEREKGGKRRRVAFTWGKIARKEGLLIKG